MVVSWNELQRTCQKAFRALGVPAGADDDGSFAVLWLEARGLDALVPLSAALFGLEQSPPRPLRRGAGEDGVDVLDAGGQPAVSVASDAIDFAVARMAERGGLAEVLVSRVEGGVFVAGALAQRPNPPPRARVEWWDRETRRGLDLTPHHGCRFAEASPGRAGSDGGLEGDAVRIALGTPGRHGWREHDRSWRTDADEAELERRATYSLTHGIDVPDALWTRLLAYAKRTLVPASRASRKQGAGGGEYND